MTKINTTTNMNYTMGSMFSGIGGKSQGFTKNGFKEIFGIEIDKHAIETFKLNYPDVNLMDIYIKKDTGELILKSNNLEVGSLDCLLASPPCQSLSILTSKCKKTDEYYEKRNCFIDTLDVINTIKPKTFMIENVPGALMKHNHLVFAEIVAKLHTMPYHFEIVTLDSSDYGVPQTRKRLIIIGVRNDLHQMDCKILLPKPNIIGRKNLTIEKFFNGKYAGVNPGIYIGTYLTSDKICYTLTATASMKFRKKDGDIVKPSIRELMRLSTFDDSFLFPGLPIDGDLNYIKGDKKNNYYYNQAAKRLGNTVPVALAYSLSFTIKNILDTYYSNQNKMAA